MNKGTKKRFFYNEDIIKRLISKYGVSKRFVTMSLSGDRKSETSESIVKDYKRMSAALEKTLSKL